MSSKAPIPALQRIIFRGDFNATADYVGQFVSAASKLKDYPQWNIDGGKIILTDPKNRRSATVDVGCLVYEQDSGDETLQKCSIDEILSKWGDHFQVTQFRRLGFRKKFLIDEKIAFEHLVTLLNAKMFRLESFSDHLPKLNDTLIRFDCSEKSNRFHITIGPVQRREIFNVMEFNRNHLDPSGVNKDAQKIVAAYPETAIFMDVDVYRVDKELGREAVTEFLLSGEESIKKITSGVANYLFD